MKINKLRLLDFRCFEDIEIELSNQFNLLIGDNGSGKTATLDALAISIGDLLSKITDTKINDRRLSIDDMRHTKLYLGQELIKETSKDTFIEFYGYFYARPINWITGRRTNKFYPLEKGDLDDWHAESLKSFNPHNIDLIKNKAADKTNPNTLFPIAAYYGTGRLWKKITGKKVETLTPDSRLSGYRNCLNPASDLEQIFRWFKTQELAALQKKQTRHVLEAVRNAIIEMIPGANRAWWDVDWDEILIETEIQGKTQTIPFHLLSDGYRNMIGMVADIAYRMATLNPQLEADVIKQTEGIVLIDEIDLHLHPKWQREVVGRLLNTFPKVQFVATTHSPFIIQSLYGREDCLLWDLEKAQPIAIESESIEDIAEDQQHVDIPQKSKRYLDMMEAAEAYYRKLHEIKDESNTEVMALRSRLDELSIPFSNDPAFAAQLKFERDSVLATKNK